ncbi:TDT family transporter [Levilactobacillus bambusae]|uniref:C4-dicarboxylate ABC transporter n=1 Tax=Levilactobacillus bambusae TaxID=2024736 RepID=A0A2V1MXW0_9LACO|nr:TDT family transporter [Levilactobacillus bambusae]PWF99671.1 C4-dicarboxylate ABC transporter [Levilactobacillus bambusae]
MISILKKLPMAICGLILGIASLGNLFVNEKLIGPANFCGGLAIFLMFFVVIKLVSSFETVWAEIKNPVAAATLPTFTMAMMVIATHLGRWGLHNLGLGLWLVSIVVQFMITGTFIYFHLIKPEVGIEHVYPSWFVTFVGIGVAPVTAGQFIPELGRILLVVALIFYAILLPIVLWRLYRYKEMPEGTLPLITITAAPASLCLSGYLFSFNQINIIFAVAMGILAQLLYFATVLTMIRIYVSVRHSLLKFFPSFAAFTFPMVISATGLFMLFQKLPYTAVTPFFTVLSYVEQGFAICVILFVLLQYSRFVWGLITAHHQESIMKHETLG